MSTTNTVIEPQSRHLIRSLKLFDSTMIVAGSMIGSGIFLVTALFAWLLQRAEDENCTELRLDSAVFRTRAHRFYFQQRMDIACFHFRIAIHPK
jgi:hypothetical protein